MTSSSTESISFSSTPFRVEHCCFNSSRSLGPEQSYNYDTILWSSVSSTKQKIFTALWYQCNNLQLLSIKCLAEVMLYICWGFSCDRKIMPTMVYCKFIVCQTDYSRFICSNVLSKFNFIFTSVGWGDLNWIGWDEEVSCRMIAHWQWNDSIPHCISEQPNCTLDCLWQTTSYKGPSEICLFQTGKFGSTQVY